MTLSLQALDADDINKYSETVAKLFKMSFEISFEDRAFSEDFILQKVKQCEEFVRNAEGIVVGAFAENDLVGICYFYEKDVWGEKMLHLNHIAVLPNVQGQGVGSILLQNMENYAANRKIAKIDLDVTISNSALKLYKKFGYIEKRLMMLKDLRKI